MHPRAEAAAPEEEDCFVGSDIALAAPVVPEWEERSVVLAGPLTEEKPTVAPRTTVLGACDPPTSVAPDVWGMAAAPAETLPGGTELIIEAAAIASEAQADSVVSPPAAESVLMTVQGEIAAGAAGSETLAPDADLLGEPLRPAVAAPSRAEVSVVSVGGDTDAPVAGGSGQVADEDRAEEGIDTGPVREVEDSGVGIAEHDVESVSTAGTDGASLAHALGELWQEAGVAPPLDVPGGGTAVSRPIRSFDSALQSIGGDEAMAAPHGYGPSPSRVVGSFAARAQAQEKVSPRKVVRAVGMVVSGLLAIGLTYGVFKFFGWGTRPRPARPAAPQKAEPVQKAEAAQPKAPRPGKDEFVPDWKGLKSLEKP